MVNVHNKDFLFESVKLYSFKLSMFAATMSTYNILSGIYLTWSFFFYQRDTVSDKLKFLKILIKYLSWLEMKKEESY